MKNNNLDSLIARLNDYIESGAGRKQNGNPACIPDVLMELIKIIKGQQAKIEELERRD